MYAAWHSVWEDALFEGNAILKDFAAARAKEMEITSIEEAAGRIQAVIKLPQSGNVSVQVSLAQRPLPDWESNLTKIQQQAPEIGYSLQGYPDIRLHAFLSRLGWPLLPQGLREVQLCTSPHSYLEPCPFSMGVLIEVGWMIESDPWVLLSLRGLSRGKALQLLQVLEEGARQPVDQGTQMPLTSIGNWGEDKIENPAGLISTEKSNESFWGNARAIRAFGSQILLCPASPPPISTLGAPPLEDADESNSLVDLLARIYGSRFQEEA